jgi:hypothetical protein
MHHGVLFYNGKLPEYGRLLELGEVEFEALKSTGIFSLPTCNADDGQRVIDLKIFCVRVTQMTQWHHLANQFSELSKKYKYLAIDWESLG